MKRRRVMLVAGARPNFMKIAPVHRALAARSSIETVLVHTGQHYDEAMSRLFFDQLGIPEPEINLEVGSASHALQTAEIMRRFEPVVLDRRPDLVVVVGDVNSTAACALVAKKIPGVGLAHVEAGLRSFDRSMPEEINRLVTDALSDLLFTSEPSGARNLRREGVDPRHVHFVGNVMIDTLEAHLPRARQTGAVEAFGLAAGGYVLVTMHRPANVDDAAVFDPLMDALARLAADRPVVFPVHPRTRPALDRWRGARQELPAGLRLVDPLGYLEFLDLMAHAQLVLTDSGGVQEETTALGVPCLTLRPNTERPVTVDEGTNELVGQDADRLLRRARAILAGEVPRGRRPALWDGRAAERIADVIEGWDGTPRER
ncbi:MAG: UDP-N-acetylglucosamine 2-epimerase (non-hydrolyzing) [Acidobacteria bacterium]|nr:MAG: UDP-N-acetylglucosamine 2-epimerase (non-hydrolyzing) [Acidobacteriota bacterium]